MCNSNSNFNQVIPFEKKLIKSTKLFIVLLVKLFSWLQFLSKFHPDCTIISRLCVTSLLMNRDKLWANIRILTIIAFLEAFALNVHVDEMHCKMRYLCYWGEDFRKRESIGMKNIGSAPNPNHNPNPNRALETT